MRSFEIPNAKDVITGELAIHGEWLVASVHTNGSWPVHSQKVPYRGRDIWILPVAKDVFPGAAIKRPPDLDWIDCQRLLARFLSAVAWVEQIGILVEEFTGGGLPRQMGRRSNLGLIICDEFDLSYLPEPADDKALLALALMREGRVLNHPGYSFLSFYRVIEVAIGRGKRRQIDWINGEIEQGLGNFSKDAIAELTKQGIADIGGHLYESGRCAMAHAAEEPIIDPDDPTDSRRLWSERPIMLALAERAIEQKLGVATSLTVYHNHFYELAGFKRFFGDEIVACLLRGDDLGHETTVNMPDISVRIRRKQAYPPLSRLTVREMTREKHSVRLMYVLNESDGEPLVQVFLTLDFAAERLSFDLFKDIFYRDSGSADGAELVAEILRFQTDLFGNGQLQIFDADSGELISRKDAYIPVNMIHNPSGSDARINRWKTIAEERRALDQR